MRLNVQPAKFHLPSLPLEVNRDAPYLGDGIQFDFLDPANLGGVPKVKITYENGKNTTASVVPTGLPSGNPPWKIVPHQLKFTQLGDQVVTVVLEDALGRFSTTRVEFVVRASAPTLTASNLSIPLDSTA